MIKRLYRVHIAPEVGLVTSHFVVAASAAHFFDCIKTRWPQAMNVHYELLGECEYYVPLAEMVEMEADPPPVADEYPPI